jgi:hypothetical protein
MNDKIGWSFRIDDSDEWDGFNHSGIEHFAGNPLFSVGREICQNSCDASTNQETVHVIIKIHEISTELIPDIEEFRTIISSCYDASSNESDKAHDFFKTAKKELSKNKIKVLEIYDYNTKGMKGPSKNGTPFYAFIKAKGQSKKETDAGGSYGIGQFAPFTVSKLRTIFVSTVFLNDNDIPEQYTQGKSILMSHDLKGSIHQGVGYWGVKEKCKPLIGVKESLQKWQRVNSEENMRKSTGSTIWILAFDDKPYWEESLGVSIAQSFFGSIQNNNLNVDINGKIKLSQNSILDYFSNNHIRDLIDKGKLESQKKAALHQFDSCRIYLEALHHDPKVFVEESEMNELGRCELRIILDDDAPKSVSILRNGMSITDSQNGLISFSDFKGFAAVLQCKSKKGNELLRLMEPPKHDAFEPERLNREDQKRGRKALSDISKWVRKMLKRHAKDPVTEITAIDELSEFFGEEGKDGSGKGMLDVNPYGKILIKAKPIKIKVLSPSIKQDDSGLLSESIGGDEDIGTGDKGGNEYPGKNSSSNADGVNSGDSDSGKSGSDGRGTTIKKQITASDIRMTILDTKKRQIMFTPHHTGTISIAILAAGADSDYDVEVLNCNEGSMENGMVELDVEDGKRKTLIVELNQELSSAIKLVAYEI